MCVYVCVHGGSHWLVSSIIWWTGRPVTPPLREAANEERGCLVVLFSDPANPLCPPCWLLLITAHIQTSFLLFSFYSIHSICSAFLTLSFPASLFECVFNRCVKHLLIAILCIYIFWTDRLNVALIIRPLIKGTVSKNKGKKKTLQFS